MSDHVSQVNTAGERPASSGSTGRGSQKRCCTNDIDIGEIPPLGRTSTLTDRGRLCPRQQSTQGDGLVWACTAPPQRCLFTKICLELWLGSRARSRIGSRQSPHQNLPRCIMRDTLVLLQTTRTGMTQAALLFEQVTKGAFRPTRATGYFRQGPDGRTHLMFFSQWGKRKESSQAPINHRGTVPFYLRYPPPWMRARRRRK